MLVVNCFERFDLQVIKFINELYYEVNRYKMKLNYLKSF